MSKVLSQKVKDNRLLIKIKNYLFLHHVTAYNNILSQPEYPFIGRMECNHNIYVRYYLDDSTYYVPLLVDPISISSHYETELKYYQAIFELDKEITPILKNILSFCKTRTDYKQLLPHSLFSIIEKEIKPIYISSEFLNSQKDIDQFKIAHKEDLITLHNTIVRLTLLCST